MELWLKKYLELLRDKPDIKEYGWRHEMVPLLLEKGLGFPRKNIDYEKERADIRVSDDNGIPYIVFETKIDENDIRRSTVKQKAMSYCKGGESYVILASKHCWLVYTLGNDDKPQEIRFDEEDGITNKGAFEGIKYALVNNRFQKFKEGESATGFIKLYDSRNFDKLIEALKKSHQMLYSYAMKVWPYLNERYALYLEEKKKLDQRRTLVEHNVTHISPKDEYLKQLDKAQRKLERIYAVEIEAIEKSYPLFCKVQPYSRDVKEKTALEIYLKEACYFALNRALMMRILEDKDLLNKKISGKGVHAWREFTRNIRERYQDLLRFSFWDAEKIYNHFFQEGPYGWYLKTDGGLGDVMLKTFYLLNSFDFSELDRDSLKALYQKYYDPEERKKLGEFYTPPEVVNYLLKAVGWPGEGKLLDFACGSGGFLVEALREKLKDMERRGLSAEAQWQGAGEIYGFDINPFAAHIAEMNLLFMLVDKFRDAMDERKELGKDFTLPDLNIFIIDALLDGREVDLQQEDFANWPGESYFDSHYSRDTQKYDYLVGNPPYIRNERLSERAKDFYQQIFEGYKEGNTDIFAYFVKKGMDWLDEGGKMGLIVSQSLAESKSSNKVRSFLEQYTIQEIVPLEWANVFKFSSVNPFLIVISKKKPIKKHRLKIIRGIRSLEDLENREVCLTEIYQNEWKNLAPDGSWRLEVTAEDLPILDKLSKYPKPFRGEYGMTFRLKEKEKSKAEDELLVRNNTINMKNPKKLLDGRELRSWSIEWQGRYVDYDSDRIDDPKSEEFFKIQKVIIPKISLTVQSSIHQGDFIFRDSILAVKCDLDLSLYIQCSLINNILLRYYHFLILRTNTLEGSKRSQFHPRVVNDFIIPTGIINNTEIINKLEELSRDCHSLAHEMVNGDRLLSDWIEEKMTGKSKAFASFSDSDLAAFTGELTVEEAYLDGEGRLVDGGLFQVSGGKERLTYILQRAALEGKDKLARREIEEFRIPAEQGLTMEINAKIGEWLARKPTLAEKLREKEREIDRIVLDACEDLSEEEKNTIVRRCSEFPLSEVLKTPLPGKPTKKIIVKTYIDRYK